MISDHLPFSNIESSLLARISYGRVFGCIVYTEQRENYGTMILHGVCYSAYTSRKGHIATYGIGPF